MPPRGRIILTQYFNILDTSQITPEIIRKYYSSRPEDLDEEASLDILADELDYNLRRYLTPREAQVLRMRYGLEDGQIRTLSEVGEELDISHERARQIESEAVRILISSRPFWLMFNESGFNPGGALNRYWRVEEELSLKSFGFDEDLEQKLRQHGFNNANDLLLSSSEQLQAKWGKEDQKDLQRVVSQLSHSLRIYQLSRHDLTPKDSQILKVVTSSIIEEMRRNKDLRSIGLKKIPKFEQNVIWALDQIQNLNDLGQIIDYQDYSDWWGRHTNFLGKVSLNKITRGLRQKILLKIQEDYQIFNYKLINLADRNE